MIIHFTGESPFQAKDIISYTKIVNAIIKDEVEGDINLSIRLLQDANTYESFTKYVVENSHKAEIRIFNASNTQYVRTTVPILLGTYKRSYKLYLEYLLEPADAGNQRVIKLVFSISKQ